MAHIHVRGNSTTGSRCGRAVAWSPSISRKGTQLVYQHVVNSDNIWRLGLKDEKHLHDSPVPLISARGINWRPSFSPDGKKIAFESNRLGYSDIWECDNDGSNCVQLTSLQGVAGTARWSPDSRNIAFEFAGRGREEVFIMEVPGGRPHLVPTFLEGITARPIGREMDSGSTSILTTKRGPFNYGKYG